jgi:hypothetical protein
MLPCFVKPAATLGIVHATVRRQLETAASQILVTSMQVSASSALWNLRVPLLHVPGTLQNPHMAVQANVNHLAHRQPSTTTVKKATDCAGKETHGCLNTVETAVLSLEEAPLPCDTVMSHIQLEKSTWSILKLLLSSTPAQLSVTAMQQWNYEAHDPQREGHICFIQHTMACDEARLYSLWCTTILRQALAGCTAIAEVTAVAAAVMLDASRITA